MSAGSAFEVPITLALAGVESNVTVTAEAPVIESARSQIALDGPRSGSGSTAHERPQFS